jgi:hypothetical protein
MMREGFNEDQRLNQIKQRVNAKPTVPKGPAAPSSPNKSGKGKGKKVRVFYLS